MTHDADGAIFRFLQPQPYAGAWQVLHSCDFREELCAGTLLTTAERNATLSLPKPGLYGVSFAAANPTCPRVNITVYATIPEAPAGQTRLVMFGDSLTDDGSGIGDMFGELVAQITPEPYLGGRFTNGPTWAEYLAKDYLNNTVRLNFATVGAELVDDNEVGVAYWPVPSCLAALVPVQKILCCQCTTSSARLPHSWLVQCQSTVLRFLLC